MNIPRNHQQLRTPRHRRLLARALSLTLALGVSSSMLAGCTEAEAASPASDIEQRLDALESTQDIRAFVLRFGQIADSADLDALSGIESRVHSDFTLDVVDFHGGEFHFEGVDGLMNEYGPIMVAAQSNLATSAVDVDIDGDHAMATFKFINSVDPPEQLDADVDYKILLLASNTATFVREDGVWMLESLELVHSLAYPGSLDGFGG